MFLRPFHIGFRSWREKYVLYWVLKVADKNFKLQIASMITKKLLMKKQFWYLIIVKSAVLSFNLKICLCHFSVLKTNMHFAYIKLNNFSWIPLIKLKSPVVTLSLNVCLLKPFFCFKYKHVFCLYICFIIIDIFFLIILTFCAYIETKNYLWHLSV